MFLHCEKILLNPKQTTVANVCAEKEKE